MSGGGKISLGLLGNVATDFSRLDFSISGIGRISFGTLGNVGEGTEGGTEFSSISGITLILLRYVEVGMVFGKLVGYVGVGRGLGLVVYFERGSLKGGLLE